MVVRFITLLSRQIFRLLLLCCRTSRSKDIELLVLRQEVAILRRQVNRPQVKPEERMVLAVLTRALPLDAQLERQTAAGREVRELG
jgi:putative transposase